MGLGGRKPLRAFRLRRRGTVSSGEFEGMECAKRRCISTGALPSRRSASRPPPMTRSLHLKNSLPLDSEGRPRAEGTDPHGPILQSPRRRFKRAGSKSDGEPAAIWARAVPADDFLRREDGGRPSSRGVGTSRRLAKTVMASSGFFPSAAVVEVMRYLKYVGIRARGGGRSMVLYSTRAQVKYV